MTTIQLQSSEDEPLQSILKLWVILLFGGYAGRFWSVDRIFVRTPPGRQRFNVLGALNAVTHQVISIVTEGMVNSWSMNDYYKIEAKVLRGARDSDFR